MTLTFDHQNLISLSFSQVDIYAKFPRGVLEISLEEKMDRQPENVMPLAITFTCMTASEVSS